MKKCVRDNGIIVAGLVLLVLATNIPFLNQPIHMDDGIYLLLAKNIHQNFWFPQDKSTYFEGLRVGDIASTEHPWPLTSYLLAFSAYVGGGFSEMAMHLGFLIFPIVLSISMYCLASRFSLHPAYATLIFITMPVVCVMSHTLMTDIPLLSFWVSSVAVFCHGVDKGNKSCIWAGALIVAGACLISYSGLCLVPLLSLYAFLRKNRHALIAILTLPLFVLGYVLAINSYHYHRFPPNMLISYYLIAKRVLSPELLFHKLTFLVLTIGAVTVFPVTLLILCKKRLIIISLIIGVTLAIFSEASKYSLFHRALFVVLFCGGFPPIIEIAGATIKSFKGRDSKAVDDFFLSIWFIGFSIFCVAAYMNGSARYLLPATPPLVLILIRRIERGWDEIARRRIAVGTILFGGLFGTVLAVSDFQFAEIYRHFASVLKRTNSSTSETNLWFTGEWGFRAYLEEAGGQELGIRESSPKPRDLLIVPTLAMPYKTLFSETLGIESIVLIAPSRIRFEIPPMPKDSVLSFTIGMPFHSKSDGVDFRIGFASGGKERELSRKRIIPYEGMQWHAYELSLAGVSDEPGSIILAADVGPSGNADADWLAIARARISCKEGAREVVLYDFRKGLKNSIIEPVAGVQYHTDRDIPVFPMTVWLKQEPPVVLWGRYEYRPSLPLRLLDGQCHAGFWSSGWGLLPFSVPVKKSNLESISVYKITRAVDKYDEFTPSWY